MIPDSPISKITEDKFARSKFAENIAKAISNRTEKESLVIGIDGKWGSGKTSFINLILENLNPDSVIIYKFNPWILGSHENLVTSFMKGLVNSIRPSLPYPRKIYEKFREYTKDITSASFSVPIIPFISYTVSKSEDTLDKQKDEINKLLCDLNKIIIVIDDLDRLDPDDIKTVVKTIKSIADFKNTVFLVAYDRSIVAKYLNQIDKSFTGKEYLKKIINVNYNLSLPDRTDIYDFLFPELNKLLIKYFGTDDIDKDRWSKIFQDGIDQFVENMRDAKLLVNSLKIILPNLIIKDVNPIDVIAVEVIRVFAPEMYSEIAGHSNIFTGEIFSLYDEQDRTKRAKTIDSIIESTFEDKDKRKGLKTIIYELFPQLISGYGSGNWNDIWTKDKRVCSIEKFPFYFKFGIPKGSISDEELDLFIEEIESGSSSDKIINILKEYDKGKKLNKFISRLFNNIRGLNQKKTNNFLFVLWNIADNLIKQDPNEGGPFFDLQANVFRLSYNVIINNIKEENRLSLIKKLANKTNNFYELLKLLDVANNAIEKNNGNEILIPKIYQGELKKLAIEIIDKNINKLLGHPNMLSIIFIWKRLNPKEDILKDWLDKNLKKNKIAKFLSGSTGMSYGSDGNKIIVDRGTLQSLGILEKIDTLVKSLEDKDWSKMKEKEKIAVNAFLESKSE